ncbi:hypothetical protein I553_6408 [Mycobacterium xenopi 4042]|uniref:Uncharacterized protein n=1 Tax=Mycobacterium xenopi 4042 TaxID=1299334 RepID=X8BH23_MYCXE|nr:hypothetical protein I553_6408 [Mycobacterium xenopi 4042]
MSQLDGNPDPSRHLRQEGIQPLVVAALLGMQLHQQDPVPIAESRQQRSNRSIQGSGAVSRR